MRPRIAVAAPQLSLMLALIFVITCTSACTFYGERPAKSMAETTGGEGMERVFWQNIQTAKWTEIERSLASNYAGITPSATLDRTAALDQYRQLQLKDFSLGDLKTELNGTTIVVTYTITLNGSVNGNSGAAQQPLPSTPQHMMTVWQKKTSGWVQIAHSVSR
jgi:hypothetical protein